MLLLDKVLLLTLLNFNAIFFFLDWDNREELEASANGSLSSENIKGGENNWAELKAKIFGKVELYLGKMIMEKEGSLLIIGGKGNSGKVEGGLKSY